MDWKALIAALIAKGLTQAQIAEHCGTSQSTISDLACGTTTNPRFQIGDKLRALAERKKVRVPAKAA